MKDDLRSAICLVVRHRCDIISLRCLVGPPYIVTFPPHHAICHLDLAVESIRRFLQLVNASENMDAIGVGVFSALENSNPHFSRLLCLNVCEIVSHGSNRSR